MKGIILHLSLIISLIFLPYWVSFIILIVFIVLSLGEEALVWAIIVDSLNSVPDVAWYMNFYLTIICFTLYIVYYLVRPRIMIYD
ncbi:MAG: hypothetical protein OXU73_02185 [Candidatus Campbellbacteria bacterium]|nr:hypothetical protein [Candidatus Campbellbacteria bacterium]